MRQGVDGGHRHRSTAIGPDTPGRQVVVIKIVLQQAQLVHGWNHQAVGHALTRCQQQELRRLEGRHDDQFAGAACHRRHQCDQASDVA